LGLFQVRAFARQCGRPYRERARQRNHRPHLPPADKICSIGSTSSHRRWVTGSAPAHLRHLGLARVGRMFTLSITARPGSAKVALPPILPE
jgi:hypothetical protein